jgi:hypothetical protein
MEKYKNIVPDDVFHVIPKGITYELCVGEKNVANFTKFSGFLVDNISADLHYCYVVHFELHDGGIFTCNGGFKFQNLDFDTPEGFYNYLIDSHLNGYSASDPVNYINISFHPYDTIMRLKELKSKVGL